MGTDPSADSGATTEWGGTMPPSSPTFLSGTNALNPPSSLAATGPPTGYAIRTAFWWSSFRGALHVPDNSAMGGRGLANGLGRLRDVALLLYRHTHGPSNIQGKLQRKCFRRAGKIHGCVRKARRAVEERVNAPYANHQEVSWQRCHFTATAKNSTLATKNPRQLPGETPGWDRTCTRPRPMPPSSPWETSYASR